MQRPSSAILGSIALHGAVAGLLLVGWSAAEDVPPPPMLASVPVSIVSSEVIEAAPADNPSETPVIDDGATAPVEAVEETPPVPEPTPPTPAPPTPRPPTKAPTPPPAPSPRPAPKREATPPPPRPAPPRPNPAPARPAPKRDAPSLDLDSLADGPRQPGRTPATQPRTGDSGAGTAPLATGPQVQAILRQVIPNWQLNCDTPGARELRIRVRLTLSVDGRITQGPTLVSPESSAVYRATADNALRAIRQTAPFDVPPGFEGAQFAPTFNVESACANR